MSDDLNKRGPRDRSRINVNEDDDVRYWCKELGCTEQELRDAVKATTSMSVAAVRSYLKARNKRS